MITADKVEIFKKYKGYYDGYYLQNRDKEREFTDEEWQILDGLMQDLYLIRTGVASRSFKIRVLRKLIENCENKRICISVFRLEKFLNEDPY